MWAKGGGIVPLSPYMGARKSQGLFCERALEWTERCLEVLPDYHIVYSDMIGEGNLVAFRWTVYATHRGGEDWIFGPVDDETKIEWSGIDVFHLADGKIVKYYASARDEDVKNRLLE